MTSSAAKIILCICTYRRPLGLRKLLESLTQLQGSHVLEIVVADNDVDQEGIAVCDSLAPDYPFTIHTVRATEPGLSAARNVATGKALSLEPELIAFLDDDEYTEPQWLSELLRIQKDCSADVVGGPTRPVFPEHTPVELQQNPYYGADMMLPDASACQLQAGGNFLVRASILKPLAPTFFHPAFTDSGGEDLAFFTQLHQHGCSMYWAANAIVHEPVPLSRLESDWLRKRVINIHNSRVRVMQLLQPGLLPSSIRALKTCALGAVTLLASLAAWVSPSMGERAKQMRWKFTGKLSAHLGRATVRGEVY